MGISVDGEWVEAESEAMEEALVGIGD